MVTSVTEGEDKPLKYPLMFRSCELVVINKIDLLPHLDFDLEKFLDNVDTVNPGVQDDADQRQDRRGRRRLPRLARRGRGAGTRGGVTPAASGKARSLAPARHTSRPQAAARPRRAGDR